MADASPFPPLRVLHCPANVGAHAAGLARAERKLGLHSTALALEPPLPGFEVDGVLFPPGTGKLRREWRRWRFVLSELRGYDVVHFNFGSTLLPSWHPGSRAALRFYARVVEGLDLRLLPDRVAVFVTYQGDDARQRAPRFDSLPREYFLPKVDAAKRRAVARLGGRADGIFVLNPDLLDVLPPNAAFLPYASVDPGDWQPVAAQNQVPVVVHTPSDRAVKGTEHVVRAVERLRGEGVALELALVERVPRAEARAVLEQADVVVDQLLSGWYGGVAVEAMALGKPTVAYLADKDLARVPPDFARELPIVRATSETLVETLRELLTRRRDELGELGRRGRAFVERWHDPLAVARTCAGAYSAAVRKHAITTTSTNSPPT